MLSENTEPLTDELVIQARDVGKCYRVYEDPRARLKQALWQDRKKYYREFWALRNVSFGIRRGESLGIIGRNGSGKSTLLQIICGTLEPTEGSISTRGSIAALLELGSGFNPEFTGIENVYLNASLLGLSRQKTESRLDDIKAFADIGDFINQPVKTYSSGMLVRLAFAVIANVDPSVLVVDEALSVGDAVFGQRCMRFIRRFTEQGTLLFVSHDLNSVSSLCQRALWIDSGKLRIDSNNAAVIKAYTRYCQQSSGQYPETKNDMSRSSEQQNLPIRQPNNRIKTASQQFEHTRQQPNQVHAKPQNVPKKCSLDEIADWKEGQDYGNKNAEITKASLIDSLGEPTSTPRCGDIVRLAITAHCIRTVHNFMAGFIVRDKTGMIIWGENNIGHDQIEVEAGSIVTLGFEFTMPFIRPGSYAISVAISENDVDMPTVMHYKPDAFIIEPILGGQTIHGVFSIPSMILFNEINP